MMGARLVIAYMDRVAGVMLRCKLEMADSTSSQNACRGCGSGRDLLARGVINLVSYRRLVPAI